MHRLLAAGLSALLLAAAPLPASAQWWEDDGAFDDAEEAYEIGDPYNFYGFEGADQLGPEPEIAIGEETGIFTEERMFADGGLYGDDDYLGYYDEDFETDTGWNDWFAE